jgi:tetratricopeptide (TPR) repeat protein
MLEMYIAGMRFPDLLRRCFEGGRACFQSSIAVVLLALTASAQQMPAGHDMGNMLAITPPDRLPVPVRMTGIGNAHIAITATPEAQAWFDQGLNLLHDFWDFESMKAFQQGVRVDPNRAMCWWGLSQAEQARGKDLEVYAKTAIEKASQLRDKLTEPERLYIEAAQIELAGKGKRATTKQQIKVLRKLVNEQPEDTQARLSLALALEAGYDKNGEPKKSEQEAIRMLENILRDVPNDSASNHYWIHAIEPGNHPERAIQSAALLATLAPTSGHMVHMPGHIYYRVGNYAEAEHWFSTSMAADERYMQEQNVSPDDDWNYAHNMMYAIANLLEQGRLNDANALSDHLASARGQLSASLYIWSARDQMSRISKRLPVALRIADWDAVLAMLSESNLPKGDKAANLRFLAAELTDYAKGMKALDAGNPVAAQEHSLSMDAGLKQMKEMHEALKKSESSKETKESAKPPMQAVAPDALPEPILKCLNIQSMELRAGVLAARHKLHAAKRAYEQAAKQEKKLGYHEPPFSIRPVAETEGAALLKAKDYKGAEEAYRAALVERPNSGFGLYGLALTKETKGDLTGAREAYAAFLEAWSRADADLPEVTHAHQMVSSASNRAAR